MCAGTGKGEAREGVWKTRGRRQHHRRSNLARWGRVGRRACQEMWDMRYTRTRMRSTECTYLDSCLSARLSFPSNTRTITKHRIQNQSRGDATRRNRSRSEGRATRRSRERGVDQSARCSHGGAQADRRGRVKELGPRESESWGVD